MRGTAATIAALLLFHLVVPAARAFAQAASPFPEVAMSQPRAGSHGWSYAALGAGAGLVVASFFVNQRADDRYREYLAATDPQRIAGLYDETRRLDTVSNATLIGGEALIAVGLYLRFLRPAPQAQVQLGLRLEPDACALSLRF